MPSERARLLRQPLRRWARCGRRRGQERRWTEKDRIGRGHNKNFRCPAWQILVKIYKTGQHTPDPNLIPSTRPHRNLIPSPPRACAPPGGRPTRASLPCTPLLRGAPAPAACRQPLPRVVRRRRSSPSTPLDPPHRWSPPAPTLCLAGYPSSSRDRSRRTTDVAFPP